MANQIKGSMNILFIYFQEQKAFNVLLVNRQKDRIANLNAEI